MEKVLLKSGKVNTEAMVNLFFNSSKLDWYLSDQTNLALFSNKAVMGLASLENPSMNLLSLLQNEALVDAQNGQKPQPFCGPGLKAPLTPVHNTNRC